MRKLYFTYEKTKTQDPYAKITKFKIKSKEHVKNIRIIQLTQVINSQY